MNLNIVCSFCVEHKGAHNGAVGWSKYKWQINSYAR